MVSSQVKGAGAISVKGLAHLEDNQGLAYLDVSMCKNVDVPVLLHALPVPAAPAKVVLRLEGCSGLFCELSRDKYASR